MKPSSGAIMLSPNKDEQKAQIKAFNRHLWATYRAKSSDFNTQGAYDCAFDLFFKMQHASDSIKALEIQAGIRIEKKKKEN